MNRTLRVIAVVAVLGMVAAACGNKTEPPPGGGQTPGNTADLEGGTLHMAMLADVTAAFDAAGIEHWLFGGGRSTSMSAG